MTDHQLEAHRRQDGRFGMRTRNRPSTSLADAEAGLAGRNYETVEKMTTRVTGAYPNATGLVVQEFDDSFGFVGITDGKDGGVVVLDNRFRKEIDEQFVSNLNHNRTWLNKAHTNSSYHVLPIN